MLGVIRRSRSHHYVILVLIILGKDPLYSSDVRTSINAEIVKDVINYEDEKSSMFVRGRFAENIYDRFFFNFSMLRDINEERYDYTWDLQVKNIKDCFDFTIGNYNLNFGSGLMMGKKGFRNSDPFSRSIIVTRDKSIIPSTGSNPAYSFFGSAVKIFAVDDDFAAEFVPFYSLQRRYPSSEEVSNGYISSSLSTLTLKTDRTGNSSSVDIINRGALFSLNIIELLTVQTYFFKTDLVEDSGRRILWEYDRETGNGISSSESGGLFIGYDDDFISLFIEPGLTVREYRDKVTGKGLMWGAGIKSRMLLFSVKGKTCDSDFYSEYSSGDRTPEDVFEIKTVVIPYDCFEAGVLFYNEKNIKPSNGRDYYDGVLREEIFSGIKPVKWVDINLTISKSNSYKEDMNSDKKKISSSVEIKATDRFFIKMKSDIQKESSDKSFTSAIELKHMLLNYFVLSAGYTDIRVEDESIIYASVIPVADAEARSKSYNESAKAGALKLRYKKDNFSFHFRWEYIQYSDEMEMTVESSLGFTF